MWHIYFNECKAAEDSTGDNELGSGPGVPQENDERPSLEFLEKANDFHTPKKVKVSSLYNNEGTEELNLGYVNPLNTKDLSSSETGQSEVQSTLQDMLEGWKINFQQLPCLKQLDQRQGRGCWSGVCLARETDRLYERGRRKDSVASRQDWAQPES